MKNRTDARAQRTREALLEAFFALVLSRPYEQITVQRIVARAGIARSTFYEHFAGKPAILTASLAGPFGLLADTVAQADNTATLTALLEHFWSNRAQTRGLFCGAMRARAVGVLARLIETRLRRSPASRTLRLPRKLAAIQLAEVLFAPLTAWLLGEAPCSASQMARALRSAAVALTAALRAS